MLVGAHPAPGPPIPHTIVHSPFGLYLTLWDFIPLAPPSVYPLHPVPVCVAVERRG